MLLIISSSNTCPASPTDHVVGEVDMGALVMFNSLNPERILAAAMCSGMAKSY